MLNFNYMLKASDYTCKNALLYGNFYKHCQKATLGSLKDRFIHGLIVTALVLPIIGQIAALFEMFLVKSTLKYLNTKKVKRGSLDIKPKHFINRALSSEATKSLMKKANFLADGWLIEFVSKDSPCGAGQFGASCSYNDKIIFIRENLSFDTAFSLFVFELTNAIQADKHRQLWVKARVGLIEEEEFAKESEHIEYKGTLLHHLAMIGAIQEKGWDKSLDRWSLFEPFESFWEKNKNTAHANYYREDYRRISKRNA